MPSLLDLFRGGRGPQNIVPGQPQEQQPGLLSDVTTEGFLSSPFLSNLGAHILANNRKGVPLGAAVGQGLIAANRGQKEALRNQALRDELAARQRRRKATSELQELFSGGNVDPRNPRLLGLLSEISPDAFASGLLGQAFPSGGRAAGFLSLLDAAGIDPKSEKGQELIGGLFGGGGNGASEIDTLLARARLEALLRQFETDDKTTETERAGGELSIGRTIDGLLEVADLNEKLEGTLAETGIGFDQLRSFAAGPAAFLAEHGFLPEGIEEIAADFQRFENLTGEQALRVVLNSSGLGPISDAKLNRLIANAPSIDKLSSTNRRGIADALQFVLDEAKSQGIDVPNRAEIEQRIKQMRRGGNKRGPVTEQQLFQEMGEVLGLGRPLNEADIRRGMREEGLTRELFLRRLRKQHRESR